MPFPSVLNTFARPTPNDRLDSPSHSALHNSVSSALGQVEAVIGIEGSSSVAGTLMSLVKSPGSDGGGHIQSANKGGTGQTSYAKGDLLVATSSSVLTKLALTATNGLTLVSDSAEATGIRWGNASATKVAVSTSSVLVTGTATVSETSLMSAQIPGSTIGTNNAVRVTVFLNTQVNQPQSVLFKSNYGSGTFGSVLAFVTAGAPAKGTVTMTLMGNGAADSQVSKSIMEINKDMTSMASTSIFGVKSYATSVGAVNSSANQNVGLTSRFSLDDAGNLILMESYVIEKIT